MPEDKKRFEKKKLDDLERPGKVKVYFNDTKSKTKIVASIAGVKVEDIQLSNRQDLEDFAYWLSEAWTEHKKMLKGALQHVN